MAIRNRTSYARDPVSAKYQGYPYGETSSQQVVPSRDPVMGSRDASVMRRGSDLDPLLSRRLSRPPYPVADHRGVSGRSVQGNLVDGRLISGSRGALSLAPTDASVHTSQHLLGAGLNRLPYEQGGLIGPGGVSSLSHSLPTRGVGGVGAHNYGNADSYSMLQQQQVQLSDGSLRTMYSVPEPGSSHPVDAGLSSVGSFRGVYASSEEANLLAAAQQQKLQQQVTYQGRQIVRDGTLIHVSGWEEQGRVTHPLSPTPMPMSPRRDDMVGMMSPRRQELTPPPMSPRRDDFAPMMSPRRDDRSPIQSPNRRRNYPTVLDYGGRLPHRRVHSPPSREDEYLVQPRLNFPMSPRRFSPAPHMSSRDGWDYDIRPASPPRPVAPMSPRRETPTRSPVWGTSRHSAKAPSQWDVLPGKGRREWNSESGRYSRRESRRDYPRIADRNVGYGAEFDSPRRWSGSRRGEGRYGSRRDDEDICYRSSRRTYDDHQPHRYGMANSRPVAYNTVVNQRVGLVTKYIERERAERAAKESTGKPFKDRDRTKLGDDENPQAGSIRPSRTEHRNEKDTLAAAIAKTTASLAKERSFKHEKSSIGHTAPSVKSAPAAKSDKNGGEENKHGSKSFPANMAGTSADFDGTPIAGSSGQPSIQEIAKDSNQEMKDRMNTVVVKEETGEAPQSSKDYVNSGNNSGLKSNGQPSKSANGITNADSKSGGNMQRETTSKRPSLVMEIERVTKSRKLAEQQKHMNSQEVEETYYDANELSADFVTKAEEAGTRFLRMINDDHSLKRRYEGEAGPGGLHCLVCGKGFKTYSDIYELITHAQESQVQSNRVDHMGFRKALIDVLKLDIKDPQVSNVEAEEDMIVWPPVVVVENTRTGMGADRRWEGVTNSEMALLLNELGHLNGRAKSIWDKFGHRGIVHVEYEPTLEGIQEAERLHNYFLHNGRGRVQWDIIRPFKTGLPGFDTVPEGPDFTRFDEATKSSHRVLYGYLALKKDVGKIFSKKQRKKVQITNRKEVKAKLEAQEAGEQVAISVVITT